MLLTKLNIVMHKHNIKPLKEIIMAQFTPPFAKEGETQEQPAAAAAPAAPEAPAAEAAAPAPEKKKVERKATRIINKDDIQFVCANVKGMSYNEMAEKRGLTRHQVNRILMDIKAQLRESAGEDAAKKEKVESYIQQHLSRPEDSRVGAKKGSPVRDAMDDVVADILGNL
jgi:3-oxoacyl-ACP reductase-like protein